MSLRRVCARIALLTVLSSAFVVASGVQPASASLNERWSTSIPGARFHWSSPTIADVNGSGANQVVVGGLNGSVYAFNPDGSKLWESNVGAAAASSPAVGDVVGDGFNEVVVGYGDLEVSPNAGGVAVLNRDGGVRCKFETSTATGVRAVFNSPAIGDINGDGVNDIVFGSLDHYVYAIDGNCALIAKFNNADTIWSAPALRDVDGDRQQEIFIGGDATKSNVAGSFNGGVFRSLRYDGSGTLAQRWMHQSSETFQGSAGFATLSGQLAVVSNAGSDYCRNKGGPCGDSNKLWAFDVNTGAEISGWDNRRLDGGYWSFLAGPAVGDVDGDGRDDVVISGFKSGASQVRAFLANGSQWTFQVPSGDEVTAPAVIVDTTGGRTPEVVVGTSGQVYVLEGPTGNVVQSGVAAGPGNKGLAHKSAAAAGVLGGKWALVSAGFDPSDGNRGYLYAYDMPTPAHSPWPMHQKNPRRLGGDPTDSGPIKCSSGYWLVAADGGIFSFGPLAPFHGSTGDLRLNQPIVGMTGRPDRSGYWFVARDGGIFAKDVPFYGSQGDKHLNQPIVGMAARPQGDGYWLVARDGGIFTFGNAGFHGSQGGAPLNQPIVGMAATPSGLGYWLVAADGGIFSFGDAKFEGSTGDKHLNQPIVGMASSASGHGYWFVASDGGIFSFGDAVFHGSHGDTPLNKPIVGMRATPSGDGYWFVATDGGIFSYGDAEFCGSTGSKKLNQPVVGMG